MLLGMPCIAAAALVPEDVRTKIVLYTLTV